MRKETVIELITKMIESQDRYIENNPEPKVENLYRHGVRDAYTHALLLIQDLDQNND